MNFFTAWFCPYAQRAWIALEHCGIKYKSIEALVLVGNAYKKDARLLAANPAGLVPTLTSSASSSTGKASKAVCESLVCVQFIHDMVIANNPDAPLERRLLSRDPFFRAHERRFAVRFCETSIIEALIKISGLKLISTLKLLFAGNHQP